MRAAGERFLETLSGSEDVDHRPVLGDLAIAETLEVHSTNGGATPCRSEPGERPTCFPVQSPSPPGNGVAVDNQLVDADFDLRERSTNGG